MELLLAAYGISTDPVFRKKVVWSAWNPPGAMTAAASGSAGAGAPGSKTAGKRFPCGRNGSKEPQALGFRVELGKTCLARPSGFGSFSI